MPKEIFFIRHARTPGNLEHPEKGGIFLGRNSDYSVIQPSKEEIKNLKEKVKNCKIAFCSPAKRCKETLDLIKPENIEVIIDKNLHELDYGDLDGKYINESLEKNPYLVEEWKKGLDPKYPNGENIQDLYGRFKKFLESLKKANENEIIVCTHSFFMRVVFGYVLNIPMKEWFKIKPTNFEAFEFELTEENELIYKGPQEQKTKILKNFY